MTQILTKLLELNHESLNDFLEIVLKQPVRVQSFSQLGTQDLKKHGSTVTFEISFLEINSGVLNKCFLKIPSFHLYGEDLISDSGREVIWRLEGYSRYLNHSMCLGAGSILLDGTVQPLTQSAVGYFVIESGIIGQLYADRLNTYIDKHKEDTAITDATLICSCMTKLHQPVLQRSYDLYCRMIRENLMNSVFRLIDSAKDFWMSEQKLREEVEHLFLSWRIFLTDFHEIVN